MYQWLCADLAATDQDFIIAFWHHPPYTKGSHDSDNPIDSEGRMQEMRERFLPVLDAYGVDLVLARSQPQLRALALAARSLWRVEHATIRCCTPSTLATAIPMATAPIRRAVLGPSPDSGGVYSVVGSSSSISGGSLNHPVMRVSLNILGSLLIDVDGRQLDARFLGVAGNVLDHFQIVKGPVSRGSGRRRRRRCLRQLPRDRELRSARQQSGRLRQPLRRGFRRRRRRRGQRRQLRSPARFGLPATGIEAFDLDSSGAIGDDDIAYAASSFGKPPGPSGLACAGTIPCSAR